MRFVRRILIPLLCLGTASACSPRTSAPVTPLQPPKNMLFRVTGGSRSGTTVYLLGSVHLLSAEHGTLTPDIDSAFARAKTIAFETSIDTLQMRGLELFTRAKLPAGTTLQDVLSPETYAGLEAILPQYNVNLHGINTFKPWMVSLSLTSAAALRAKFQAQYGVDMQIHARAKAAGKRELGLEPVDFQLTVFDKLSAADQEKMLAAQLISPDSAVRSLLKIQDAWIAGDTTAMNTSLNESFVKTPAVFALLIQNRNRSWIPAIEELLNGQDNALVVVGAAHLVGKEGVLALLRGKGYKVERF